MCAVSNGTSSRSRGEPPGGNLRISEFAIEGEPTAAMVRESARAAKGQDYGIGFGVEAIDAAEAIAAIAPNSGEPLD